MAKKGQKFRKFTDEERSEIVGKYLKGSTYKRIANEYEISWKTVESMVRKYRKTGTTVRKYPSGRPKEKNLTKEDWQERYEILKKYQAFLKAQRERK